MLNSRLLGIIGCQELIAAEAKYHPCCYKKCNSFVLVETQDSAEDNAIQPDDCAVSPSFEFIVQYVEHCFT